ncbi:MAG: prolipoprotein diacylglyceryl transferase [Mangrovibacterium sp.]
MNLSFIYWNVNPIAFHFFGAEVRWYGLFFPIAFALGYLIGRKMFKQEGISQDWLDTLFIVVFLSGIFGARLGHVFFYDWSYFKEHPSEILKTWHGGLASHGGAIGVMLGLFAWSKITAKRSFLWVLDKVVVCAALLGSLVRLGNLMNSEIYGVATQLPWGFVFQLNGDTVPNHPTQLYESLCYFAIFLVLFYNYFHKKAYLKEGYLTGLFGVLVFASRFFIEFIKNDQSVFEAGMWLNMGQLLSIPFIIYGAYLIWKSTRA